MRRGRCAAVGLLIAVGAAFGSGIEAGQRAMRIGVQLPLGGERAAVGRTIKGSVEMAVEAVNQEGGVGGVPVEVIYEDDRDTEQGAREALGKLVQDHRAVACHRRTLQSLRHGQPGDRGAGGGPVFDGRDQPEDDGTDAMDLPGRSERCGPGRSSRPICRRRSETEQAGNSP